jgi:ABC-2 type transport system ATP-binding protein/sodium transport system ATP-binding protein
MIHVEELTRRFTLPEGGEVTAVDRLSFTAGSGEVFGLLGPNGAGKTTTLRMLLGLLKPTSGRATIAGYDSRLSPDEVKRRVGYVSANVGVYPHLTVRETLLFFGDLYGVSPDTAVAETDRLAHLFGIETLLHRRSGTLSTGQRQRLNLARALVHRPPVLLLDEPTLGLDVLGSQVVAEFVAHARSQGQAVILTTHRLDEAERLCDRFGLLHKGRLIQTGTLQQLRDATGCAGLVDMFLKLAHTGPMLVE